MALQLKGGGSSLQNLSMPGKVAIGVIFAGLVGAAYFVIFYGEVDSEIKAEQQKVASLQGELERAKEARKAFNRDLAEVKRREQLVRKQKTILPDDAESPAFLSTVQNVATISGVQLTGWTPQDEAPEEFYAKVPMQLSLTGKFHQIARFFFGIGQADRIINMENITMQAERIKSKKPAGQAGAKSIELEDTQLIKVECLATAFRALRQDEGSGRRRRPGAKPGAKGGAK